jgi:hypothetical protein
MKSHPFLICVFISTLILSTPDLSTGGESWVYPVDGVMLRSWCNTDDKINNNVCEIFITGLVNSRPFMDPNNYMFDFCIARVKLPQLRLVVAKWLNEHPQDLDKPSVGLILSALREYFPCDGSRER